MAEPARRERHRGPVIAPGCGHQSGGRDIGRQQPIEGPARLERARVLQLLELECDALVLDDRCAAHVTGNAMGRLDDVFGLNGNGHGSDSTTTEEWTPTSLASHARS